MAKGEMMQYPLHGESVTIMEKRIFNGLADEFMQRGRRAQTFRLMDESTFASITTVNQPGDFTTTYMTINYLNQDQSLAAEYFYGFGSTLGQSCIGHDSFLGTGQLCIEDAPPAPLIHSNLILHYEFNLLTESMQEIRVPDKNNLGITHMAVRHMGTGHFGILSLGYGKLSSYIVFNDHDNKKAYGLGEMTGQSCASGKSNHPVIIQNMINDGKHPILCNAPSK